jgi:hypothetical protein
MADRSHQTQGFAAPTQDLLSALFPWILTTWVPCLVPFNSSYSLQEKSHLSTVVQTHWSGIFYLFYLAVHHSLPCTLGSRNSDFVARVCLLTFADVVPKDWKASALPCSAWPVCSYGPLFFLWCMCILPYFWAPFLRTPIPHPQTVCFFLLIDFPTSYQNCLLCFHLSPKRWIPCRENLWITRL